MEKVPESGFYERTRAMRNFITALSVLLMALLVVGSAEAKAAKVKKEKPINGTIVSVAADGGSMVLQTKGKKGAASEQKTITINPSTTIATVDTPP